MVLELGLEETKNIKEKSPRNASVDVLKILATFFVVILHFNFNSYGGAATFAQGGAKAFLLTLESLSIVAVPIFILITGYFSTNNTSFKLKKIVGLYIMQFSYTMICYCARSLIFKSDFSAEGLFRCMIPNFYFINLYAGLMVFSPLINKVFKFDKKNVLVFIIILSLLFLFVPTVIDIYGSLNNQNLGRVSFVAQYGSYNGYTIACFILYYLIGGFIRTYNVKISKLISGPSYLILTLIITSLTYMTRSALNYDNIFVAISSISLFMFFKDINLKSNKVVTFLSKCSLGVFVLHVSDLFVFGYNSLFHAKDVVPQGLGPTVLLFLELAVSTFAICVVLDIIFRLITLPIKNWLYSTKIMNYELFKLDND